MVRFTEGQTVRYNCPAGYHAYGLFVSQSATYGFVRVHSASGTATYDMRFFAEKFDWIGIVVPIVDLIGGSDIDITVHGTPEDPQDYRCLHSTGPSDRALQAEIAELILVRSDWREVLGAGGPSAGTVVEIESASWAKPLITAAAARASAVIRSLEADRQDIPKVCYDLMAAILASEPGSVTYANQARLLLLGGMTDALSTFLNKALALQPYDQEILKMSYTMEAIESEKKQKPDELLNRAKALAQAGSTSDAEKVLKEGVARFPGQIHFFADLAWLSLNQKDWDKSVERWSAVMELFPDQSIGYMALALSFDGAGRYDEAEQILDRAMQLFPDLAQAAVAHVEVAVRRNDLPEATIRGMAVRDRFPDNRDNRVTLIDVLTRQSRFNEARCEVTDLLDIGFGKHDVATRVIRLITDEAGRRWLDTVRTKLASAVPSLEAVEQEAARVPRSIH